MKTYEREALIRRLQLASADLLEAVEWLKKENDVMGKLCAAQGESWVASANALIRGDGRTVPQDEFFEKWEYVSPS